MSGSKLCPDCGQTKPLDDFPRFHRNGDGRGTYCKPCHNARNRQSKLKHGGPRHYHLRRRYGLSVADVERMVRTQGGLCPVCGRRPATQVDHDHTSGVVRGILCIYCNAAMGAFRDNPAIIANAIDYLEKHGA